MEGDDLLAGFDDAMTSPAEDGAAGAAAPAEFLTDQENAKMVARVKAIALPFNGPDFELFMAGIPIVTHTVKQLMMKDMKKFLRRAVLTSFAAADVAPIADLGLFSCIGVLLSLLYTLILLPALLAIFPLKQKKGAGEAVGETRFDRFLDWVAFVTTSP